MKLNKLLISPIVLIALMAVPVHAGFSPGGGGSSTSLGTSLWQVAYELLGNGNNLTVNNATSPLLIAGSTLTTEMYLGLTLSGPAIFSTGTIYSLCANNSGDTGWQLIGSSLPYSSTNLTIPLTSSANLASILAGNQFYVTSDDTTGNGCAQAGNMTYIVPGLSAVGNAPLSATMFLGGGTLHQYSPANVIQVLNQIGTTLSPSDLIQIDYITGPANGTTLVPVTGSTNQIAMSPSKITVSNQAYNSSLPPGSLNLAATLYDTSNWYGITSAYLAFNGGCVSGNYTTAVNATPGSPLTLTTPSGYAFPELWQAGSNSITLCITVSGNTTLPSRIITGSYVYLPGTWVPDDVCAEETLSESKNLLRLRCARQSAITFQVPYGSGSSNIVWQTWSPNGYQAFCPYVYAGSGAINEFSPTANDTFVRFVNSSAANAIVFAQVYNGTAPNPTPYTLGVIAPYSAGLFWGGDLAVMAGIPYGTTYAVLYTVTALPSQITGVSYYKRITAYGSNDRLVPLLSDRIAESLIDWWSPVPEPTPACTPHTCDYYGYTCGLHDNGCDGTLDCGTCGGDYSCEGGACIPLP